MDIADNFNTLYLNTELLSVYRDCIYLNKGRLLVRYLRSSPSSEALNEL